MHLPTPPRVSGLAITELPENPDPCQYIFHAGQGHCIILAHFMIPDLILAFGFRFKPGMTIGLAGY